MLFSHSQSRTDTSLHSPSLYPALRTPGGSAKVSTLPQNRPYLYCPLVYTAPLSQLSPTDLYQLTPCFLLIVSSHTFISGQGCLGPFHSVLIIMEHLAPQQVPSQDPLAEAPWYSRLCIFCRDRYFSRFLLSFISFPYLPTVPSSDRMKWECMLLSVVSLLRGLPRVWYRHTTCKTARTGRVRFSDPSLGSTAPKAYLYALHSSC